MFSFTRHGVRLLFSLSDDSSAGLGCCGWLLVLFSLLITLLTLDVEILLSYERAVIFRLGRIIDKKAKGPGIFFVLPCTDNFLKVDLRTVSFNIPPQEVYFYLLTQIVHFWVKCPVSSRDNVSNVDSSTHLLAQITLRNVLGTKNLAELLSHWESMLHSMQATLEDATDHWDIKVERVEIKDVKLPRQLQRAQLGGLNDLKSMKTSLKLVPVCIRKFYSRKSGHL
uniref:Stomatin (EPB72)-like 3a n=1 Tax=Scleropages formosus TaxID=113540 RepID=A0A8C9VA18_SCLFO